MKKLLTQLFFILIMSLTISTYGQEGSNDVTFNIGNGANGFISTTALQSDGKIIIGGVFTNYNGTDINYICRLHPDGILDPSFNIGTRIGRGTGIYNFVSTVAIQKDGKIIIGGVFQDYNGIKLYNIARLNTDGSLDTSFSNRAGRFTHSVIDIKIQSDGKIIIGGEFYGEYSYNGATGNHITRLNMDGSLDTTFKIGKGADRKIHKIAIQSDGKIIIGGHFRAYNDIDITRIARLNADGSLDANFKPGKGADGPIEAIAIQNDGRIIIGGWFSTYNGIKQNNIARLNKDGSLDVNFNIGKGANKPIETIAIQNDGKIIIGGSFGTYNGTKINRIACININGDLDISFKTGKGVIGLTSGYFVHTITIQNDSKIIIGGRFTYFDSIGRNNIARIK
jgi:uncharacterized delta-60 repeat protein